MKPKTIRKLKILSRVIGGVLIASIVIIPFVWPYIRFNMDYKYIRGIYQNTPGINPFINTLPNITFTTPVQVPEIATDSQSQGISKIKSSYIQFKNDNFKEDGIYSGYLENESIKILLADSVLNEIIIHKKSNVSFLKERNKNTKIVEFEDIKDSFEKLKKILCSQPSDIDPKLDLSSRYLGLYLYTLKAMILPKEAEKGVLLFETKDLKGIIFGHIPETELKIILYSKKYSRFFSILVIGKNNTSIDLRYIQDFLGTITVSEK